MGNATANAHGSQSLVPHDHWRQWDEVVANNDDILHIHDEVSFNVDVFCFLYSAHQNCGPCVLFVLISIQNNQ